MIQKLIWVPKDELQIIFKFHHQLSVNHDIIVFWCTKYSLKSMFILVKSRTNQTLRLLHFDIVFDLWFFFFFQIPKCEKIPSFKNK
jgi:hypothetical protein